MDTVTEPTTVAPAWERDTYQRALEAIAGYEDRFGAPPPDDAMRDLAQAALRYVEERR